MSVITGAAVCLSVVYLSVESCQKEHFPSGTMCHSGIKPLVSFSSSLTKSGTGSTQGEIIATYALAGFGEDSLYVVVYESDNDDCPAGTVTREPRTKGQVVTTSSINAVGQQFMMSAWLESENRYDPDVHPEQLSDGRIYDTNDKDDYRVIPCATVTRGESGWAMDSTCYWRNCVPTNFWAVYPHDLPAASLTLHEPGIMASDSEQKEFSFDYSLPLPSADFSDAENQPDLCFAYSRKSWDESVPGNDNTVEIKFNHALSAVYFDISEVLNTIAVKRVGFNNVPSTAHCDILGTSPAPENGNPGVPQFSWSGQSDLESYRQTFENTDFDSSMRQQFDESDKVFMMIPGTLDAGTELWAEFEVNGVSVSKSVNISKFDNGDPVEWRPGKRYLYRIMFKGLNNYTFYLDESGHPTTWGRTFNNTTTSAYAVIPVVSAAVNADNAVVNDVDWKIKSVQFGTSAPQTVNASSFSDIEGISASRQGNQFRISVAARTAVNQGSNDYWRNQNPVRSDHLDWSPEDWSGRGVIDLSKTDFATDDPSQINAGAMTTANCYIIRHAGTYRLPLVYGNAVVNGVPNVEAYSPSTMAGGQAAYFLPTFKDYLDQDITGPSLPTASSCEILWQDEAEVLKNPLLITDGGIQYVQFEISPNDICQNNALVAVKDEFDRVMWSWHIWTTNNPGLLKPAIPVRNNAEKIYQFLPLESLGHIDTQKYIGSDGIKIVLEQKGSGRTILLTVKSSEIRGQSNGCYYQFGRKDPMCRTDSPSEGTFTRIDTGKVTLGMAQQNPSVFYGHGPGNFDWCSSTYYNLWSGKTCQTGKVEQDVPGLIKTVYDPSPAGYMMPASCAVSGFTTTGGSTWTASQFNVEGDFDFGWQFRTGMASEPFIIFFPAGGVRARTNGNLNQVGICGEYWTAVAQNFHYGYHLYFISNSMNPFNQSSRACGFPVRPVQE